MTLFAIVCKSHTIAVIWFWFIFIIFVSSLYWGHSIAPFITKSLANYYIFILKKLSASLHASKMCALNFLLTCNQNNFESRIDITKLAAASWGWLALLCYPITEIWNCFYFFNYSEYDLMHLSCSTSLGNQLCFKKWIFVR